MKIKLYIVTYKNPFHLNQTLESLYASDIGKYNVEISIINNHSEFSIDKKFAHIKVLHNDLRPDFSTGHLSRNWNQAIINGFKSLAKPDCDVLVASQDDVLFVKEFFAKLLELHKKYSFITFGYGDCICSYLPEAVRNIGLWDERFCNIGFQEGDYFLRALMFNKEKSTINDIVHGRLLNPEKEQLVINPDKDTDKNTVHDLSRSYHDISKAVIAHKYGIDAEQWVKQRTLVDNPPSGFKSVNFITYPYFEKDIDFDGKNYLYVPPREEEKKSLMTSSFVNKVKDFFATPAKIENKIAFIIPIHEPKFAHGVNLNKSFEHLKGQADLWFIFSNVYEMEQFNKQCPYPHHSHVFDGHYGYGNGIINSKKLSALKCLADKYEYLITYDAEILIKKAFDLYGYCNRFKNDKTILGLGCNKLIGPDKEIIPRILKECEKIPANRQTFGWWIQPPIYEGKKVVDFLKHINFELNFNTFEHLLYQNYLIKEHGWREQDCNAGFVELGYKADYSSTQFFHDTKLVHICNENRSSIISPIILHTDRNRII